MQKSVQPQVGNDAVARRLAHLTNNTLRDLMGSRLGPRPYKALRPPQGPTQKAIWEIRHSYVGKFSTGFGEGQEDEADQELAAYTNKFYNEKAGLIEAHLIRVDEICAQAIERLESKIESGKKLSRAESRTLHACRHGLVVFAGMTIYDLDQEAMDIFIDFLCGEAKRDSRNRRLPAPPGGISRRTAIQYGRRLLALLRKNKLPPGAMPWRPDIRIKEGYVPRVTLLTEHEVARLLMSLYRGWVWVEATGTWLTEEAADANTGKVMTRRVRCGWVADRFDPETGCWNWSIPKEGAPGLDKKREARLDRSAGRRRAVVRYVLLYLGTGTRDARIRALKWSPDKYNGWISRRERRDDLDAAPGLG